MKSVSIIDYVNFVPQTSSHMSQLVFNHHNDKTTDDDDEARWDGVKWIITMNT